MQLNMNKLKPAERLQSLDVLRGFDMIWIIGGGTLIEAWAKETKWGWFQSLAGQMEHVNWEGFHFEDLIFPLFMFISGVAIPFALSAKAGQGVKRKELFYKIVRRGVLLVILGIFYSGVLKKGSPHLRFTSVLGQIGLGYLFAATIVLYTKSLKARVIWLFGILAGIAFLQLAVPVPGHGAGLLDREWGINAWIDRMFLPGRLFGGTFDPEGLLCIVSAITVTLMGSLAGSLLHDEDSAPRRKAGILAIGGTAFVIIALSLSPVYPIIKSAWTVPFNLLTAGISSLLLSLFYFIIDIKGWTKGLFSHVILFFKVIGMNSITIYLAYRIIDFEGISDFFTGWLVGPLGVWTVVLGSIVLEWLLLYFLYKKKIFLRI